MASNITEVLTYPESKLYITKVILICFRHRSTRQVIILWDTPFKKDAENLGFISNY
jgi:hypothetical protein